MANTTEIDSDRDGRETSDVAKKKSVYQFIEMLKSSAHSYKDVSPHMLLLTDVTQIGGKKPKRYILHRHTEAPIKCQESFLLTAAWAVHLPVFQFSSFLCHSNTT